MELEPMLTPREKSPLPKKSPEEDWTRDAVDSEPKHYQLSYSGPVVFLNRNHLEEFVRFLKWKTLSCEQIRCFEWKPMMSELVGF